ncbi:hypothetical protein ACMYSQ_011660 [Aspergillus niger]
MDLHTTIERDCMKSRAMNRADPSPSGSYQSINQSVHRQVIKRITAPLHRDASRKQLSLAPTPIPSLPAHQNPAFALDLEFSRHSGTLPSIPSDGSIDIPPDVMIRVR